VKTRRGSIFDETSLLMLRLCTLEKWQKLDAILLKRLLRSLASSSRGRKMFTRASSPDFR